MNNNYRIESNSGLKASTLMNNNMNNNYRIESNSGLKESPLRNNKMNNKYRISSIKDTTVQNTSKTHVETPCIRRSTCLSEIKSGLKESALYSNNKSMNNKYRISSIKDTPVQNIKSGLMESALRNNNMNNNNRTTIMGESVPYIGVASLSPTPFRRRVQSLQDTVRKVVNKVKKKWNDFSNWIIDYVPPTIRVNPSSAIEKLKKYIKELYKRYPDFYTNRKESGYGVF